MKSTYKLLGVPWDGMPSAGWPPPTVPFQSQVQEAGSPDNLFDTKYRSRYLLLSKLLNVDSLAEAHRYVHQANDCKRVFIALDCLPSTKCATHTNFYQLRLSQIFHYVQSTLPNAKVILMDGIPEMAHTPKSRWTLTRLMILVDRYQTYLKLH